ncbi:2-hydroxyacid dehydrogenase [Pseudaminobacter sp. 19-2017]|uniref:2-hydroxyacid dehydrogenase n=1 Tax=Pseudaminobacter soli (ex Zhang et al. 2022) TaxID=2831468 RepID=A0A942IAZ2_9HYPH|nr:2-hydroxyacid dehydrogenase [Pseudaminobacter soli]MBS3651036.1 2-hydroxyacid dehydrogenase [Pseudaminobacter soli]
MLVQLQPMLEIVEAALSRRFNVRKLWEERWLSTEDACRVRGIVASGHSVVDASLLSTFPNLEIVASFGVGYDHIDAKAAARQGVIVTNTPDVLTGEVADLAIGLLIATVRQLPQAERYLREGKWASGPFPLSASLREKKVGILGLGRIGRAIAHRLSGFDMALCYHARRRHEDVNLPYYESLAGMAKDVDILIVAAPGGAETRHIVTRPIIDLLGPEGVIINIGRGSVIAELDLAAALKEGTIGAAGLDVFENEPVVPAEILDHPRSVVLPHIGSASVRTRNAMGQLLVNNLMSWFERNEAVTPVIESVPLLQPGIPRCGGSLAELHQHGSGTLSITMPPSRQ